ncbi:MAG: glycoside hydrolase family 3 protein [Bacillota bacterium]
MLKFRGISVKVLVLILTLVMTVSCQESREPKSTQSPDVVQSTQSPGTGGSIEERVSSLIASMTLEEKVGQMIQAERGNITPAEVKQYFVGSILSGGGSAPGSNSKEDWIDMCNAYQDAAKSTRLGIPIIYGIDAVHGHNTIYGATVFPHNIGLGAAANPELMAQIGNITAREMITTGVNWNFAPCIAVSRDERWGRTYESYSEDPELVKKLLVPYIKAMQNNKIAATAKHYAGDGGTAWGSGDSGYKIDQGETRVSEEEFRKIHLSVYEDAVKAGSKTVMVSFSSFEGVKMHEHKRLIQDVLKGEMGFKGFVVSDWEGIHQIRGKDFYQQVVSSVNAGVDMFMEPQKWKECIGHLKDAVNKGDITEERINDAVGRILTVKMDMGLFENPIGDQSLAAKELRSKESVEVAKKAVRESLVLLKNKNSILPLKKGAKIFVAGPAADNVGIQCGGWTKTWQGEVDTSGRKWMEGTTILEGLKRVAGESGGTVITDPKEANKADIAVIVLGERPYAEGQGDDGSLGLYDGMAHIGNKEAIEQAKASGLPTVTILVSGRPRIVTSEIDNWDAFVAAWLPGTEGDAIADVLYGDFNFTGKLPMTWPKSVDQIPINADSLGGKEPLFPYGYGLKYDN